MSFLQKKMEIPHDIMLQIFGEYDANIKKIENQLNVTIVNRGNEVKISGEEEQVENAILTLKI